MGYIYIMTNPALHEMVKIGYATNVEQRRKQLSTTALPYDYEVYATYETPGHLEDKKLHKMIDNLNPDLRVSKNKEFYVMTPEDAYELLESIAVISGSQDKLKRVVEKENKQVLKKPPINFFKCGLKVGDELVFIENPEVVVTIQSEHKVLYKDQITSLSAIVQSIKNMTTAAGPSYFTHNGEPLVDIANRTQWKDFV